jgi:histidine kinase
MSIEQQQYQRKLQAALDHQILLKEVNHRVKNSLQVVSSMLQLQAKALDEPALSEPLTEASTRTLAVGRAYNRLAYNADYEEHRFGRLFAGRRRRFEGCRRTPTLSATSPSNRPGSDKSELQEITSSQALRSIRVAASAFPPSRFRFFGPALMFLTMTASAVATASPIWREIVRRLALSLSLLSHRRQRRDSLQARSPERFGSQLWYLLSPVEGLLP